MYKRGAIYYHPNYTYANGNTQDKLLVVLNKLHSDKQPVIIIPVTTDKNNKYKKGCNPNSYYFRIDANEDFFPNNSLLPLDLHYFKMNYDITTNKIKEGKMSFRAYLKEQTMNLLINCLKQIKQDIEPELIQYLF